MSEFEGLETTSENEYDIAGEYSRERIYGPEHTEEAGTETVAEGVSVAAVEASEAEVVEVPEAEVEAAVTAEEVSATVAETPEAVSEESPETVSEKADDKKPSNKKKILGIIAIAAIFVILLVIGNIIFNNIRSKKNADNNQTPLVTEINKDGDKNDSETVKDDSSKVNDDSNKDDVEGDTEDTTSTDDTNVPVVDEPVDDIEEIIDGTPVEIHGELSVDGTQLVDCHGKAFQIKGVSTHGIAWFPQYVNYDAFRTIEEEWGANCIRLAMYSGEYNGYCTGGNQSDLKKTVENGVDYATQLGMYVIIDWHVLGDQNPNTYKEQAKSFFADMSAKYADYDNVIYEICNEPNGGTNWSQIKSYALEVIPIIKANNPDAVIIVGTPTWSQEVDKAAADPITGYSNIMYAFHFYADTHRDDLRNRMVNAINSGIPIFVSEFGICDASGSGANNYTEGDKWIEVMNQNGVSYNIWSLCNKNETSALISSSCSKTGNWTTNDLSASGKWYIGVLGNNVEPGSTSGNSTGNSTGNNNSNSTGNNGAGNVNDNNNNNGTGNVADNNSSNSDTNNAGNNTGNTGDNTTGNTGAQQPANPPTPPAPPTPPTPPVDPPAPPTPPASTGSASAVVNETGGWNDGTKDFHQFTVTISANGGNVSGWTVVIDFGTSIAIDQSWNGVFAVNGNSIVITPADFNASISSGNSVEVGFIISSNGAVSPSVHVQ